MLDFMDYIQLAFAEATNWNRDNSYSSLTATAQSLLDFSTPERLRVHLSSLSTPHFATSYTLGTVGLIDGSVSYLFSTVPLNHAASRSALIPLRKLSPGYRQVQAPVAPIENFRVDSILDDLNHLPGSDDNPSRNHGRSQKATLFHATLHLPPPTTLNALFLRRISPTMQLSLAVCSTRGPPLSKSAPQASLLTQLSHNTGKYSNEYLFSTDNALFGWRGLWNFGPDPRATPTASTQPLSLLSAGAEAYYSPVSSLIGMSTGLRFSTLPAATDVPSSSSSSSRSSTSSASSNSSSSNSNNPISTFPYTLTLTLTPLTGSLSTTYSLRASPNLAFSSRFGFNVYSWESEMVAGMELWRKSRRAAPADDPDDDGLEWARRKMRGERHPPLPSSPVRKTDPLGQLHPVRKTARQEEANESVLKIRVDQSWNVRLLWEGRVKELLVSAGVGLGPSSFASSLSSLSSLSAAGAQSSGGGSAGVGKSYWHGVGISVLYSS
ncbi:mitochondrial distribution and morphology protein 10 [Aspergillus brunneoviolaceus CBS 621.78]|uniref:Mitochondrial distribution and morphology protein 10 n=1 Tax=Aspergillus brunneoviolaceus CBS 621.78 TaxID=1450534 RepID=A0ACD1G6T6_9EURO|nr:mitochondrial distribution and morphology protein 10 [Aspergillus brunneoviolaceus CBS 621.78]RAH44927.1 mitochondrial distribution and morphology protein 10 [Aspergillus brunneoviolaceus CBS 621.78]